MIATMIAHYHDYREAATRRGPGRSPAAPRELRGEQIAARGPAASDVRVSFAPARPTPHASAGQFVKMFPQRWPGSNVCGVRSSRSPPTAVGGAADRGRAVAARGLAQAGWRSQCRPTTRFRTIRSVQPGRRSEAALAASGAAAARCVSAGSKIGQNA